MQLFDADNAADYLRATARIGQDESVAVQVLSGGVSNQVLFVGREDGPDFVLKQARPQLRTPDPWFCTVERIWREVEALEICQQVLARRASADESLFMSTPRILFVDRENYLFAMTAAPREHVVWRSELLAGRADPEIAATCGRLLARLHTGTWNDPAIAERLGDSTVFEQLRIEPYYEATAKANPEAAAWFDRLIAEVRAHRLCLVHADFSPKNLLLFRGVGLRPATFDRQAGGLPRSQMMMVDFETGHYGDPGFDLGFFLSHLVLKAFYHAPRHEPFVVLIEQFAEAYQQSSRHTPCAVTVGQAFQPDVGAGEKGCQAGKPDLLGDGTPSVPATIARGNQNLAGCAWARLDGTSKVDYLTDSGARDQVRRFCRWIFAESPESLNPVVTKLRELLEHLSGTSEQ
jgi:aminoglycoside phosphotransferase (APT) family kinase protein